MLGTVSTRKERPIAPRLPYLVGSWVAPSLPIFSGNHKEGTLVNFITGGGASVKLLLCYIVSDAKGLGSTQNKLSITN
jgi:hypothetical protein